jgi:hypothetical protein
MCPTLIVELVAGRCRRLQRIEIINTLHSVTFVPKRRRFI